MAQKRLENTDLRYIALLYQCLLRKIKCYVNVWLFSAYCGGLWLASVCVMCKMAQILKSDSVYERYKDILTRGSAAFDKLLWNGKFTVSKIM